MTRFFTQSILAGVSLALILQSGTPTLHAQFDGGNLAAPLVTIDPYVATWSTHKQLNQEWPRHWTLHETPMSGLLKVDGKVYGFMGPWYLYDLAAQQVTREILPTQTKYLFQAGGVALDLRFTTPVIPSKLEYASLPVTYITYKVSSADGEKHDVDVYFDFSVDWVRQNPSQEVRIDEPSAGDGMKLVRMGTVGQRVLETSGDKHMVDWGYLYVAYPDRSDTEAIIGHQHGLGEVFLQKERLGGNEPAHGPRGTFGTAGIVKQTEAAAVVSYGEVAKGRTHGSTIMLAYDDIFSVEYLGRRLRAYWYKFHANTKQMLAAAFSKADAILSDCERFDKELLADAGAVGGDQYPAFISLAHRQTWAGGKLVESPYGTPWFLHKENSSNGSIITVDVSYPASPFFALLNPQLLKGMAEPIIDYVESGLWPFPFAPHDIGRYPRANGQRYGMPRNASQPVDERRLMPVEECGNMLLMVAAYTHVTNDADFVRKHRKTLQQWADYLEKVGVDPGEQLCTDDFMGHLAHNVNLSAKTVCALGAWSQINKLIGDAEQADYYRKLAESMAADWIRMAGDGDHYRLAFDQPDTWSQKYNLVWDKLLNLGLFPDSVLEKETAYYIKIQNQYGLPLDNRNPLTKTDWLFWTAGLTERLDDFRQLTEPVMSYVRTTPHPIPFPDSYKTDTASGLWQHRPGEFHLYARVVIGGIYIQFLHNKEIWKKWASRATP